MTRRFATILVVALVVLAGCSGGPATTTAPDTETTTENSETTTSDSLNRVTVPSELVPPGANERSIVNARQLVQAHSGALGNVSHRSETTYTNLGADDASEVEYVLEAGSDGYASNRTTTANGSVSSEAVYYADDVVRIRDHSDGETTFRYATGPTRTSLQYTRPQRPVGQVFLFYEGMVGSLQATDFATINDQKVVKYQSTGMNESRFEQVRGALGVPNATLEDVSIELFVDRNGVIHDLDASMTVTTGDGEEETFGLTHRLRGWEATTPSAPSWVDAVPALAGSVSEEGRLVELENTGSESISNYTAGVAGNVSADTTVNRTLAPGETAFLYVTTDGNETMLHVRDERPDVPSDAASLPQRTTVRVFVQTDTAQVSIGMTTQNSSVRQPIEQIQRLRPASPGTVTPTTAWTSNPKMPGHVERSG